MFVKIGGCESENDIFVAKKLSAKGISVPMIETPYSLIKFLNSANEFLSSNQDEISLFANIETECGYKNLEKILTTEQSYLLKDIILGRDDMVFSLGLDESFINSDKIFEIAVQMSKMAELYGKEFSIGGKIRPESIPFIKKLASYHLTKIETKMVIFDVQKLVLSNMQEMIIKAIDFEINWIKYSQMLKVLNI